MSRLPGNCRRSYIGPIYLNALKVWFRSEYYWNHVSIFTFKHFTTLEFDFIQLFSGNNYFLSRYGNSRERQHNVDQLWSVLSHETFPSLLRKCSLIANTYIEVHKSNIQHLPSNRWQRLWEWCPMGIAEQPQCLTILDNILVSTAATKTITQIGQW